ncbi:response regulator [candidate division KSB1 bacterium]|nr:response regulator [candidate division KSB1 bacterium]
MRIGKNQSEEKERIVIGSIDYDVIRALGRRFNSDEYELVFVQKGVNILHEILEKEVDMLILDLEISGTMNVEILPVIRRLRPKLPIVLITDDFTHQIRQVAAQLGVTYQAFKPMSDNETDAIVSATSQIIQKSKILNPECFSEAENSPGC